MTKKFFLEKRHKGQIIMGTKRLSNYTTISVFKKLFEYFSVC